MCRGRRGLEAEDPEPGVWVGGEGTQGVGPRGGPGPPALRPLSARHTCQPCQLLTKEAALNSPVLDSWVTVIMGFYFQRDFD